MADGGEGFRPSMRRGEALRKAAGLLAEAGIEAPLREARLLLCAALRIDAAALIGSEGEALGPDAAAFGAMVQRRTGREPFARITGAREFFGHHFALSPATLIPRPDTETLVEAVVAVLKAAGRDAAPVSIADLGTGSGAILAAVLAACPGARGVAIDTSEEALETARQNIERIAGPGRATYLRNDWLAGVAGPFDVIVSNPPYIPSADIAALEPEVAHGDPAAALDGGADGLDAYRAISSGLEGALAPGGIVGLEIGAGQAGDVAAIMAAAGFALASRHRDLGGHIRALIFRRMTDPLLIPEV